jgi:hypothetical protein
VFTIGPNDIQNDTMLGEIITQTGEACDVTPFGSSRRVWYSDEKSNHNAHRDPSGGKVNQQRL